MDMEKATVARAAATIHASPSEVWHALTTPELVKQYMFGSDVTTDWREGSPITYKGNWNGKTFEDKGQVVRVRPGELLVVTHWSPLSGVPDTPENYHTVRYELTPQKDSTRLVITQDNNASAQEKAESEKNWQTMLDNIKKIVEKSN